MSTLANIRTKARRLTASPSVNQLSEAALDEYINTFYLHDLPQHLKLLSLKKVLTAYVLPGIDTYDLDINPSFTAATPTAYYSVEPPLYIAGYESYYTQSRAEFYRLYPTVNAEDFVSGNGTAGPYAITITNTPVLRSNVTVSAVDAGGNALVAYDDGAGGFIDNDTGAALVGAIDYTTGAITNLTFTGIITATENITAQSVPYVANRPSAVLFYDNKIGRAHV